MKRPLHKNARLRTLLGVVMVLLGIFSLLSGYYVRFVLQWRGLGGFSVLNALLGGFIVWRGWREVRRAQSR